MFLCWLPCNSAAHSACFLHRLPRTTSPLTLSRAYHDTERSSFVWWTQSHPVQTWSWSDLSLFFSRRQNSFINPKLQDILACIGYYLRLIFMWVELLADPENRNEHLHFFRVQAEGGHWRNCLQRLYRHSDDLRGVWNYGQCSQCPLVRLKLGLSCLLTADLWTLSFGVHCWLKCLQAPEVSGSRLQASLEEENREEDQFDIVL